MKRVTINQKDGTQSLGLSERHQTKTSKSIALFRFLWSASFCAPFSLLHSQRVEKREVTPISWNRWSLGRTQKAERISELSGKTGGFVWWGEFWDWATHWFWERSNLNAGTGDPCAGHDRLRLANADLCTSDLVTSVENLGDDPHTGSSEQK